MMFMRSAPQQAKRRNRQRKCVSVAILAGTMLLAACGSSDPADGTDSSTSPGAGTGSVSGGDLAATVADLSDRDLSNPIPTEPISRVDELHGKKVFYIPITQQAPQFAVTGRTLTAALGAAGLTVQICNGNSNPSDITACVNQAVGANAGAIITDSIPYALAANGFAAAQAKKIPVLITDQIPDPAHKTGPLLGYLEGAGKTQLRAIADWVIVDSGGKAKVVINASTDSPSTQAYIATAQEEFSAHCPDCKVTLNKISSANFPLIASSTSSAILANPGVNYVISEFEQYLQPTSTGVQQSGKATSVKGASTAAQINGLQMLESEKFLHADVGQASAYQGWADADAVLRMMLGETLPEYEIPIRLFTRENVKELSITSQAEASGEWFGPTDFPARFKTLWGLS
ncbi:substrate-binding domain-containing protein [Parafrankia discariae]|uniref:substrate-binding domain-containing protein n=1 Tax=Parafrankia discariae TaxID=365528 RepID=UPI0007C75775|nr:substrate-binding domain-containing protein [Parafrankia discariae]